MVTVRQWNARERVVVLCCYTESVSQQQYQCEYERQQQQYHY